MSKGLPPSDTDIPIPLTEIDAQSSTIDISINRPPTIAIIPPEVILGEGAIGGGPAGMGSGPVGGIVSGVPGPVGGYGVSPGVAIFHLPLVFNCIYKVFPSISPFIISNKVLNITTLMRFSVN
jgi:hypothetical protein